MEAANVTEPLEGRMLEGMNASLQGNATLTDLEYYQPTEEEIQHSLLVFYIVMFAMIFAQSALVSWRKRHRRSYELVTLVGLWLIPPIASVYIGLWRFVTVWSLYSGVTGYLLYQCIFAKAADKTLPRRVFNWFYGVFKASVGLGVAGYALLVLQLFGGGMLPGTIFDPANVLIMLWYGLYFGILTRDCAEVASDRIALRMGGARRMAVSVRDCGICGGELKDAHSHTTVTTSPPRSNGLAPAPAPAPTGDASVQLSCRHLFHAECIRGWLIIGKKDSCPTCQEKVDLRTLYADKPWDTRNLSWIQMLDMVRYLVVWQPTIMVVLHVALHALHLDEEPGHGGMGAGNATALVNVTGAINDTRVAR